MGILPTFVKSKVYAVIVVNTGDKMNVELKCLDMFKSLCTTLGFKTMQKQLQYIAIRLNTFMEEHIQDMPSH